MHMINFLYNIAGQTEFVIKKDDLSSLSFPELLMLMKAEQDGKIKIIVVE